MLDLGFALSTHVINTIKALPEKERHAICSALCAEFILGEDPRDHLSPMEAVLYAMIQFYVKRDAMR